MTSARRGTGERCPGILTSPHTERNLNKTKTCELNFEGFECGRTYGHKSSQSGGDLARNLAKYLAGNLAINTATYLANLAICLAICLAINIARYLEQTKSNFGPIWPDIRPAKYLVNLIRYQTSLTKILPNIKRIWLVVWPEVWPKIWPDIWPEIWTYAPGLGFTHSPPG